MGQFYSDPELVGYIRSLEQRLATLERRVATRGRKVRIAAEQSTASTSYTLLDTPDQIKGLNLPESGLIHIGFSGLFKSSDLDAGRAAIFLGSTQLKTTIVQQANPIAQSAPTSSAGNFQFLCSAPIGLVATQGTMGYFSTTEGQPVAIASNSGGPGGNLRYDVGGTIHSVAAPAGGVCTIFAAAGNYDISVRFLAATGTVTVKDRALWAWTEGLD